MKELYPDVKCKVLYQKDYLNLLMKYGLEEPSQVAASNESAAGPRELGLLDAGVS
ncbi:MAG: hypothetical protein M3277_12200 [Actinomycetota bacterium]|nr:hypothetical protein [Actinomycetota bacterium]